MPIISVHPIISKFLQSLRAFRLADIEGTGAKEASKEASKVASKEASKQARKKGKEEEREIGRAREINTNGTPADVFWKSRCLSEKGGDRER